MRIYIHTDLEGVSGIDRGEMVPHDSDDYKTCCELLMGDLNAAVDGAFAGGADEVIVLDSHGGGNNFLLDMLDPRAQNDTRPNHYWWSIMDERCDATFFIGAHAMAGTQNGFLDHTQSSASWFEYRINDRPMGELAQWAFVAGHFGVPLVMVAGDEAACMEAHNFFSPIKTAAVKRGTERMRAEALPLDIARERIYNAAKEAISLVSEAKPFWLYKPYIYELTLMRSDFADEMMKMGKVERIDARKVRWVSDSPLDLFPW